MTILASDIIDKTLLDSLAQVPDIALRLRPTLPFINWLLEHRTFSLGLARQTRKTSTLIKHLDEHSIMIVHNYNEANRLNKVYPHQLPQIFSPIEFKYFAEQRVRGSNRMISRIFMDELDMLDDPRKIPIYQCIDILNDSRHLADNVFILKVGTPVC
jgi:hypothetical protein